MTEEVAQPLAAHAAPAPENGAPAVVSTDPGSVTSHAEVSQDVSHETTVLGADDSVSEIKKEVASEINADKTTEAKVEVKSEVKSDVKPEIKAEAKPTEEKKADGAEKQPEVKKEEVSQSDEPAPLPSFEPWAIPEGVEIDQAKLGEFNNDLAQFAVEAKVDAKLLQGLGQKLLDRHLANAQAVAQQIADAYDKVWKDQTKSWYEQFTKDPEIGGERQEKTTAAAREFIRKHGGTAEQQAEIRTLMQRTGIGNHPAVIRLFAKATANLSEGKPVPAGKPPGQPQSRKNKFYGSKS